MRRVSVTVSDCAPPTDKAVRFSRSMPSRLSTREKPALALGQSAQQTHRMKNRSTSGSRTVSTQGSASACFWTALHSGLQILRIKSVGQDGRWSNKSDLDQRPSGVLRLQTARRLHHRQTIFPGSEIRIGSVAMPLYNVPRRQVYGKLHPNNMLRATRHNSKK